MSNGLEIEEQELRESFGKVFSPIEPDGARFDLGLWQSQRPLHHSHRVQRSWWPLAAGAVFACLLAVSAVVYTQVQTQHQVQAQHSMSQASIAQLVRWNRDRELYAVALPGTPAKVIFLVPKGFSIPRTISSWPPKGFTPIALLDDPSAQLGTGTGTLWMGMQSYLYWLLPVNVGVLPTSSTNLHIDASGKAVLAVPPGELYAVAWPSTKYPHRTIFLKSVRFVMPFSLTKWPPDKFEIVAVYSESVLNSHPQLGLNSYPNPPYTLVLSTKAERELTKTSSRSYR